MNQDRPDRVGRVFVALGKSVCYLALFLGMQVAVMLPAVLAAASGEEAGLTDLDAVTLTLISGLLTIAIVLAFYLIRRKKLSEALWLRPVPVPTLLTGAALAPALYAAVSVALILLPEAWQESYNEAASSVDTGSLVGVIAVALVAPVVEEFIFRGLIMTRLGRAMPGWLAVVLTAAIFGACHGNAVWFGYAFVLGVFFGWIDWNAGSIWPSILGHLTFNAIGQVMSILAALTGEEEAGVELLTAVGLLFIAAIAAPLFNRRAIGAVLRPAKKAPPAPAEELPTAPGNYDYDPWDE